VPTFASRWLMPRLPDLVGQHPELVVHIETRTRPFLFADTGFDAALYSGTPEQVSNWAGTLATPLIEEEVVPVCAPSLLGKRRHLQPVDLAALPLLQQSTRPEAWRQWFDTMGVDAPLALSGSRCELYSLTAAAAANGLGLALLPRLLFEPELARGELVVACPRPLKSGRVYWLVTPERGEPRPALAAFAAWLRAQAARAA
jgi:LysR family glycine cleavage system transcriptional activator